MKRFLRFDHVSYVYPVQQDSALREISFSLNQGEFLGILGADDAGKTTLARLANGLLSPSQGEIFIEGHQLTPASVDRLRPNVGVVFSDPENQIVGTSVEEEIAFGPGNLQVPPPVMRERIQRYLSSMNLQQYASRPPHELSGGEQQKLCIASILAMEPAGVVLDAPLTYLDSTSRAELLTLLRDLNRQGKTILYLTSAPEELCHAHRILILNRGEITYECSFRHVWNHPEIFAENGLTPPDLLMLRHQLRHAGYRIRDDSLTPDALIEDIAKRLDGPRTTQNTRKNIE